MRSDWRAEVAAGLRWLGAPVTVLCLVLLALLWHKDTNRYFRHP